MKYAKSNFFAGRDGADFAQTAVELQRWVSEIANARVHGTTQRRPVEVFETEERSALLPLPAQRFDPVEWKQAQVHRDCHVAFGKLLYSVPWRLVGKSVWVRATSSTVAIYADDTRVATHDRRGRGPRRTVEEHLPEDRAPWRHRSRDFWQARAERIAPEVGVYIREVFEADDVLSMLRTVQAIVTHLERFPTARAVAAAERARFYGSHSYGAIKNMLRQGLDLQPLPTVTASAPSPAATPRFARSITELLHKPKESHDELH